MPSQGFTDLFSDPRRPGRVISSRTPQGTVRRGVDRENVIGIDNGALRIQPLIQPGWGRAGIAYGPFDRRNGTALAVFMLNGHNTAQAENIPETFRHRLLRWWLGSETYRGRQRIVQWLRSPRKARMARRLRWWWRARKHARPVPPLDENLAVGWFPAPVPQDPLAGGNAFVMHATGPENGELWARAGASCLRAVRGVQNLQVYYVIVLRERGAAYYAASVPCARGLAAYPRMRPLAIDAFETAPRVYPGVHQSVLGQIGFRLDTRVYGVRVDHIPAMSAWYGTAHAADRLIGVGPLRRSLAERGGTWKTCEGEFERTPAGARGITPENAAVLDPGAPSGLLHAIVQTGPRETASAGLVWRYQDPDNYWKLEIGGEECRVSLKSNGAWHPIAHSGEWRLAPGAEYSLQVLDDGQTMSFYLQGRLLFGSWFHDARLSAAGGCGLLASGAAAVRSFEAHPRSVPLPAALDMGEPWLRKGTKVVAADGFEGPRGDLAGRTTTLGGKVWRKEIGAGAFDLTGEGAAAVRASVKRPNPGRTAYTIPWDHPGFADLEVNITPPGTARGQKEQGRSGFILWQDAENYIIVNIWLCDSYGGASISSFFQLDGFEDLYDAVWTNVGDRVSFGVPLTLRLACDGACYTVFINEEPVLYRALDDVYPGRAPLSINRVGLAANWEWGNDTGSVFRNFVART